MNTGVQMPVQTPAFSCFEYLPKSGVARSYGKSMITFSEEMYYIPQQLHCFTFLLVVHKISNFTTSLSKLLTF